VYYCHYHPTHDPGKYKRDSLERKPNPGMLLQAQADPDLDVKSSVTLGDNLSDSGRLKERELRRHLFFVQTVSTRKSCKILSTIYQTPLMRSGRGVSRVLLSFKREKQYDSLCLRAVSLGHIVRTVISI
jgi:histidinol phosphatase-like enzyme